ncbi:enoyl-CoA hydratase/isomerase family protein [Aestuariispira insulae]|uniref:3-hydroxyisobutyryl-CoA hydrolase n=1 Tax=Aestuariispira insulae TaxID=1461337 RepID=A0A3D9HVD1_9PROT|nr:enoyl-CoA hydratase/isomerase family protein [Aestuariispira insulae]RED53389.1 3-hydroxyisobutyryl-CoA hydrolase [Aestuariispira insulae]
MEAEILFDVKGGVGIVTLNRPKALNALTLGMIRELDPVLRKWSDDDQVHAILIKGAGEKAFCAGGDVRAVWEAGKKGDPLTQDFFREEYILNRRIHQLNKPYIAFLDGITMGGGVGLSVHGSHRIVTETTLFAMPETAIGLFPDVGGSWFLNKCPGESGMYLALTGARLKAADCLATGIATDILKSGDLECLEADLTAADWGAGAAQSIVDSLVERYAGVADAAPIAANFDAIDRCFGRDSVEEILSVLEAEGSDFAAETLKFLSKKSPTSMKLSFQQLRRGRKLGFDDCMIMEYRLSQACMAGHDFYEGIRSVLVDKDHNPTWKPAALTDVADADISKAFEPLGARDLSFS